MKRAILTSVLLAGLMFGCTDAEWSQAKAFGSKFKVTVYSGGVAVKTYTSTGKVDTEHGSDGWYFTDQATGGLVRVSGTVLIEEIR